MRRNLSTSASAAPPPRVDLLRFHAVAGDLAPLNTLIERARVLGDDVSRLAEAQREVEDALHRPVGSRRIPTPE